jgi:gas vesicle protein
LRFWSKEIEKNLSDCVQEIEDEIKNLKNEFKRENIYKRNREQTIKKKI